MVADFVNFLVKLDEEDRLVDVWSVRARGPDGVQAAYILMG
jgi:hypothetical protein